MKKFKRSVQLSALLAQLCFPLLSMASDSSRPICENEKVQSKPVAVGLSAGSGAIIAWEDNRNGNGDVYAQLLCGCDSASWEKNGIPISIASGEQRHPAIAKDTSDGAIIAWEDGRNGVTKIFAQKVDRHGIVQWAADGLALGDSTSEQRNPVIVADGSGGAIIAWEDRPNTSDSANIVAQRISNAGAMDWSPGGVPLRRQKGNQSDPHLLSLSDGGVMVVWQDQRSGEDDIYAQALDSTGKLKWDSNGVAISTATSKQSRPRLVGDGSGGAIVVWNDLRNNIDVDIFAQRIDGNGQVKWHADGVVVNGNQEKDQFDPVLDGDGQGGAIIAWTDKRTAATQIFAQRVNGAGNIQWASTGVQVGVGVAGDQSDPQIVKLYRGGASIAWVAQGNPVSSVLTQIISADGSVLSLPGGMAISPTVKDQLNPFLVTDGNEGYIALWQDFRNSNSDIFSEIIAEIPVGIRRIPGIVSSANSQSRRIFVDAFGRLNYAVESAGKVKIEILDPFGHSVATLVDAFQFSGNYSVPVTDALAGNGLRPGIYLCRFLKSGYAGTNEIFVTR